MVLSLSDVAKGYAEAKNELRQTLISIAAYYSEIVKYNIDEEFGDDVYKANELKKQARQIIRLANWVQTPSGMAKLQAKIELFEVETGYIWNAEEES